MTDPQDSHPAESGPRGFVNWKPLIAFLGRYGFMIALLLPAIILLATNETFRNPLNLSNILAQSSMVGVAAVGMTVVMILGGFDLSIGAIAAVTGLVAVLIFGTGDPLFLALGCLACIGTGALIGAFNGTLISRIGINPLIATLAMASLVRGLVLITSEGTIHRAEGDAMWITTLALGRVGGFPIAGFFFIGAVVMGSIILRYSKFGRWVYAIGGNEEAARLSGVPVSRVVITCYALMGGLAGLAGLLFTSRTGTALTTTGIGLEIDAITATVIGGTRLGGGHGAILGTVVGVILLGVIRNGLNLNGVSPFWQPFIIGCNRLFAEMEEDALRDLAASAIPTDDVQFQWFYDAAYWGQAHELIVPLAKGRLRTSPISAAPSTTSTSASTPSRWRATGSTSCTGAAARQQHADAAPQRQRVGRSCRCAHRASHRVFRRRGRRDGGPGLRRHAARARPRRARRGRDR